MEKAQKDLCIEILHRLDKTGILKHIILVGSWCTFFYKDFFAGRKYMVSLTTRDIDLLIPEPRYIHAKVNIAELLKDLGFVIGFTGSEGYIRLEHPELIIEFLVPERGRATNKPYPLPQLGLNAQALRFLDFLNQNTIQCSLDSMKITLPHPANFALHKLLVMGRRPKAEKKAKDKDAAIRILNALIDSEQIDSIKKAFEAMPKRWQNIVRKQLTEITDKNVLAILQ